MFPRLVLSATLHEIYFHYFIRKQHLILRNQNYAAGLRQRYNMSAIFILLFYGAITAIPLMYFCFKGLSSSGYIFVSVMCQYGDFTGNFHECKTLKT